MGLVRMGDRKAVILLLKATRKSAHSPAMHHHGESLLVAQDDDDERSREKNGFEITTRADPNRVPRSEVLARSKVFCTQFRLTSQLSTQ